VDVVYHSSETWHFQAWSKELKQGQLGKHTVCLVVDEAHSVSAWKVTAVIQIPFTS